MFPERVIPLTRAPRAADAALEIEHLAAGYGELQILWDVSLTLRQGKTTCLVGANGAGKTSLLRAVMGQIPTRSGVVVFDGRDIVRVPAHRKTDLGLVLVPEGRQLFTNLTVEANLDLGATPKRGRKDYQRNLEWVYELFPKLRDRRKQLAGTLSGGEQQMVAIGRGLMASPRVLMLDEPSLGLAPVMVLNLFQIIRQLQAAGLTLLLVEQNLHMALAVSDDAYVLNEGRIALSGPAAQVRAMPEVREAYLGLGAQAESDDEDSPRPPLAVVAKRAPCPGMPSGPPVAPTASCVL